MRYIVQKDPTCKERFVKFAKNVMGLDGDDEDGLIQQSIDALEQFFKDCGIPSTLSELNITDEYFEEMAKHANRNGRLANAYVPLSVEDIVNIYKNCL